MPKLLLILFIGFLLRGEVRAECSPAFTTTISGSVAQVQPTDNTPGKIHKWYFGDGAQTWGVLVYHTYNAPGTYVIKHIITDSLSNCHDSAQQTVTISFPVSCSASYTFYRDSSYLHTYHFSSTSSATGGSINAYNWKVDGNTVSNGAVFNSSLSQGRHLVCLTIQTTAGCTSTACDSILVDSVIACHLSASFTATPSVPNPAQIHFIPTPLDSAFSYSWYFGDGQVSSAKAPFHTYSPGTYHVILFVSDTATHCFDSASRLIVIPAKPKDSCKASFTYTANPLQPAQLTFTAVTNDSIVQQRWSIRPCDSLLLHDTAVYTIPNPVHTFASPGCYQVCVTLLTRTGCKRSYCGTVIIPVDSLAMRSNIVATYPNPASGSTVNIRLDLQQPQKVKLTVYNSFGNPVYTNEKTYTTGYNGINIPVSTLRPGTYYIDIQYGNTRKRSTFQKF